MKTKVYIEQQQFEEPCVVVEGKDQSGKMVLEKRIPMSIERPIDAMASLPAIDWTPATPADVKRILAKVKNWIETCQVSREIHGTGWTANMG